jgi:hypothetical protein
MSGASLGDAVDCFHRSPLFTDPDFAQPVLRLYQLTLIGSCRYGPKGAKGGRKGTLGTGRCSQASVYSA